MSEYETCYWDTGFCSLEGLICKHRNKDFSCGAPDEALLTYEDYLQEKELCSSEQTPRETE